MTQSQAGELVERSRRWWQDLEAGRIDPHVSDLHRVADVLGRPIEFLLGLDVGRMAPEAITNRREFVAAVAAVTTTGIDLERLAMPRLDPAYLRDAAAITDGLMRNWYTISPSALLPAAGGHLTALSRLLPGSRQLASVAGRTALLSGHCLMKVGRASDAYRVYALAATAARDAGDAALRSIVLAMHSSLYSTVAEGYRPGDTRAALRLLDQAALCVPASAPGRLRAAVRSRRAEERAANADAAGALGDLEVAEAALNEPSDDVHFGPRDHVELGAIRGSVQLLLGRNNDAVKTLDVTLAAMDPRLAAWRSAVLADQGAAYARLGELEVAADRLERALQLARSAGASDHVNRIRGVRRRDLGGYDHERVVERLDEQLEAANA
jgi:tetratricopeptide (TPR) repeat protein